mgnify:FL=1
MIKRKEEIQIRTVKEAQGGKGEVYFHDWLTKEDAYGHGRVFAKLVLPSGSSIGVHQHIGEFEAFYVLSGQATVTDGEQVVVLNPGDMNLCREGDFHGVENCGAKDLVLMALIMNVTK